MDNQKVLIEKKDGGVAFLSINNEERRNAISEDVRDALGLALCDHLLPGERGVDFLVELNQDERTAPVRKVLITGQAGLEDTVKAVNQADHHHYIAKPWQPEELHQVVRDELTEYVLSQADSLLPYVAVLDGPRLMDAIGKRRADE